MELFNPIKYPICFSYPLRSTTSAWTRHVPFAMCLIDLSRPKTFVELGTHYGISYCAFCQAVKELGLDTRCTAVDTWQGDPHAGLYGPEALADLRMHHDPRYSSFSRLLRKTFDEALEQFADGTIDLLHIDGFHTYEAVKHDFESWLPKMSERGVILLHDTNERIETFGVWKLFEEKKQLYPHFEFLHGHGLGILAVGQHCPEPLRGLLEAPEEAWPAIRTFFFQLGIRIEVQTELEEMRRSYRHSVVRVMKLARAARHVLSTQGPVAATKQTVLWLGGKRSSGNALGEAAQPVQPTPVTIPSKD